jgi:hypothetical protein
MRMVKSLLLGGAAGLVAVAGAQAADLPMKAKAPAVQYVKICTLYGAGFYYIPGTDTCIKIGGYIRTQVESTSNGGGIARLTSNDEQNAQTRVSTNEVQMRNRAVVTFDVRTQGEYGTLRSYYRVGWEATTPNGPELAGTTANAYWDRAFIQFAGFTVGKAQSFFDIYTHGGARNYINVRTSGDNGAAGGMLWAYTAQFGGGFSATLSLEDPRGHNLVGVRDLAGTGFGAFGGLDNGLGANAGGNGMDIPDIVANLRYDQPWGFVGVSAALHQVAAGYYTFNPGVGPGCAGVNVNSANCGHPADEWGYALGVGGQLNIPGLPGDTAGAMFRYANGAVGYIVGGGASHMWLIDGNTAGFGRTADAFFANPGAIPGYGGQLELTEAWSLNAHYEHVWTPALKTSIYGGYAEISHNGTASRLLCANIALGCNTDWSFYQIGSRTQWAPWKGQLNIGVDVVYTHLDSSFSGVLTTPAGLGGAPLGRAPTALYRITDQDMFTVMFRVQRNWYP